MKLRLISVFLLFLFSIVIAFPGYGAGVSSVKAKGVYAFKSKKVTPLTWKSLLKKCLSKGINLIEEERNLEEDEDNETCKEVCYEMLSGSYRLPVSNAPEHICFMDELSLIHLRSVPHPPPNCN